MSGRAVFKSQRERALPQAEVGAWTHELDRRASEIRRCCTELDKHVEDAHTGCYRRLLRGQAKHA